MHFLGGHCQLVMNSHFCSKWSAVLAEREQTQRDSFHGLGGRTRPPPGTCGGFCWRQSRVGVVTTSGPLQVEPRNAGAREAGEGPLLPVQNC